MNKQEAIKKVRTLLGIEVKLEQWTLENGAVFEAEKFKSGEEIFVIADEERVPVPIGEYNVEGKTVCVEEEGVISEIKDAESEEEAPKEEEVVEEEMSNETLAPKKIVESISKEQFFSEIEKLRNEINELKLAKEEVKEEIVKEELSADPKEEVEGITHTPVKKEVLHSQKVKKRVSTIDRIYQTINK